MSTSLDDKILALAGIVQALSLINRLAFLGLHEQDRPIIETCIQSLYMLDAHNVEEIFGQKHALIPGMKELHAVLKHNIFNLRYALRIKKEIWQVFGLAKQILRRPELRRLIQDKIHQYTRQAEYFSRTHSSIIQRWSELTIELMNRLGARFHLYGRQANLSHEEIASTIRALLLAAIRAAVLWHQLGGNIWLLIFERKKLLLRLEELMQL